MIFKISVFLKQVLAYLCQINNSEGQITDQMSQITCWIPFFGMNILEIVLRLSTIQFS